MPGTAYERLPSTAPGIDMYRDDYYKPHDQMGYINPSPQNNIPQNVPIPVGMFMAAPPPPHRSYYPGTRRGKSQGGFGNDMSQVLHYSILPIYIFSKLSDRYFSHWLRRVITLSSGLWRVWGLHWQCTPDSAHHVSAEHVPTPQSAGAISGHVCDIRN